MEEGVRPPLGRLRPIVGLPKTPPANMYKVQSIPPSDVHYNLDRKGSKHDFMASIYQNAFKNIYEDKSKIQCN